MKGERGGRIAIGALVALAFALRLGYVLLNPQPAIRDDALHYDDIASNLAAGRGFSMSVEHLLEADRPSDGSPGPTARRPPLYPVVLSLVYRTAGQNYTLVLILQALLGALTCYLVFLLSKAAMGRSRGAIIALALTAVYPPFVRYCGELLTETLFLFLTAAAFVAACAAVTKGGVRRAALAGAIGGMAALCRPTAMFLLPLEGFLLGVGGRGFRCGCGSESGSGSGSRPGRLREWIAHMAAYTAAFCIVLSPWVIRNYAVFDSFIPGFTSAGYNLFMGTYPPGRGLANVNPNMHPLELREELEGKGEVEADAIYTRAALRNVADEPLEYVKLVAMKSVRGWLVIQRGHDWLPTPLSLAVHGPLLILAALGAALERKDRGFGVLLLAAGAVTFTGFHALVVSNLRYNLPAVPFAIVLASAALARLPSKIRPRRLTAARTSAEQL